MDVSISWFQASLYQSSTVLSVGLGCNEQKPHFSLVLYEAGNLLVKSFN